MSTQIALDNICRKPTQRWAHSEYSLNYHKAWASRHTGLPEGHPELWARLYDWANVDFLWHTNDGLVNWAKAGRVTDLGHASYAADGSDLQQSAVSPFQTEEEVWAFDPVAEYGLPDLEQQVSAYEQGYQRNCLACPNQLVTGGYYRTLVSGAIATFGWDMLLTGASDPDKMERVFDSFFRRGLFHMKAWAQTSATVIIQHDDFVWTSGPFLSPDYYRRVFIPRYAELWKPLHAAGKKVLFCSDGDYRQFAGDILAAGADGLIFEPVCDFTWMAEQFGERACLVGSQVDCRDLTFGNWDKVQQDIDRTCAALQKCQGAIVAVGNHLPPNIPEAMMDRYFEYLLPRLSRA